MTDSNKPTTLFWVVAVIALIWNAIGTLQYLASAFMGDAAIAMLPEEQQEALTNTPSWVTAMFAIAVWFGLLAAITMLLKRKWAYPFFVLSLIGVLGQNVHNFFLSNNVELFGAQAIWMPVIVILLAVFFVVYSKGAAAKGWLR